ncbi:hypothetical protein ACWD4B_11855 [Streptomyces sp. NPDC002536]
MLVLLSLFDAVKPTNEESPVGLCLFPDGSDADGPDVSWSYHGFHALRQRLAETEGFILDEMQGFRSGERPWSDVTTALEPFLHHPDDDGELSAAECASIIPRLEAITDQWLRQGDDLLLRHHIDDTRQLVVVLRRCVEKNVALQFG